MTIPSSSSNPQNFKLAPQNLHADKKECGDERNITDLLVKLEANYLLF